MRSDVCIYVWSRVEDSRWQECKESMYEASQLKCNYNPTRGGVLKAAKIQKGMVVAQRRVQKSFSATSRIFLERF